MLVNWKVNRCETIPKDIQAPDYYIKGEKYWFFRYFEDDVDVDIIDIKTFKVFEKIEQKLHFYPMQSLKAFFKIRKYDIVISHGMPSGICLAILRRLFKTKAKHIVFDIGSFNSAAETGRILKLNQFASKSIDGLIYHTSNQINYYKKFYPWLVDKCNFVKFGTDLAYFEKDAKPAEKTENFALAVGYAKRDYDTLIKAFNKVKSDIKLKIIGNDQINTNGDKRIELYKRVPKRELNEIIKKAKFCILPLREMNYSFGQMTLLQQMYFEKCVLVANVSSTKDYVKNEDTAILYENGDAEDLRKKIEKCANSEELCREIGKKAKQSVINNFSEERMAKDIEEAIKRYVDK